MTWGQILESGRKQLVAAGISEADLDAWYLFEWAFGISRAQYFLRAGEDAAAPEPARMKFEEGLRRRAMRVPLQHILGTQEFMGLEFEVNENVLIPRQDTETLVETVLSEWKEKEISILDMCTGSGCIAVSLAALGGYARVEGADISEEALQTAERNAGRILGKTIRFRRSDLFSAFEDGERFDVIVSNPPYIPSADIDGLEPEVREFEPRAALDGKEDGLFFYRGLAGKAGQFLKEGGRIYLEIGFDQGAAVGGLLEVHGFTDIKVIRDLAGKDRVVRGSWKSVRAGGMTEEKRSGICRKKNEEDSYV